MDNHDKVDTSGRFVVVDEQDVAGGGIIFGGTYIERERIQSTNLFWSEGRIDQRARTERNGHRGMVIWLTGLSGSGKSTLARALETNLLQIVVKFRRKTALFLALYFLGLRFKLRFGFRVLFVEVFLNALHEVREARGRG